MATQDVKITATITVTNCSSFNAHCTEWWNCCFMCVLRFRRSHSSSLSRSLSHSFMPGNYRFTKQLFQMKYFSVTHQTAYFVRMKLTPSPPSSVSHKHSNIQSMAIFRLPPPPANSFEQRFLLSNLSTYQKVDAIARLKCEQNDTRWRGFVTDCHYLLLRCDALLHDNCSLCVCTRAMFQMIADFKCNFLCRALFECLSIHLH